MCNVQCEMNVLHSTGVYRCALGQAVELLEGASYPDVLQNYPIKICPSSTFYDDVLVMLPGRLCYPDIRVSRGPRYTHGPCMINIECGRSRGLQSTIRVEE